MSDKPRAERRRPKVNKREMVTHFQQRIRALLSVDEGVRDIVEQLEQSGQLQETLVVFTSDNGYLTGEHRHYCKIVPYEESLRVPPLVRGPRVAAGTARHRTQNVPALLRRAGHRRRHGRRRPPGHRQ